MLITVFTPTYNRTSLLSRLFTSLQQQDFMDFEWVIVDDGSTDDTHDLIMKFVGENVIPIKYVSRRNGGKHRAINDGVKYAQGELFFIVDSDDILPPDALERIAKVYGQIKDDKSFGGVAGIDAYPDGRIVGSGLPMQFVDCNSIDIRSKYHITGDLSEVFRTEVMREFPFPEIEGERFCPEVLVWNRIAQKYRLRYFNKVIYTAEYQVGGLTSKIVEIRMKSPIASMMCYAEMNALDIPFKDKLKAAVNYWRFWFCSKAGDKPKIGKSWRWIKFFGWLMYKRDLSQCKK
ncbi:glycosyltransferase family 2 protein [Hoylesella pleuritidis]|uniref:glycosyltransferase family 2 protein n=1 Tax=Hoylesella pleuritidis TaxID=407975 RepID=UPI002354E7AB|nr:glycosyltransferase family A protein [Hoylesella pleuritidis]